VAVGGEPVCDLAGFVAATFNRGTRLALVPTTLAAQADSAIGGKNAVNMPQGRNLVGSIHQPTVVIADVTTSCENVAHGFRAGLAEIAKHALISRSDLLQVLDSLADDACAADVDAVHQLVTRSVEIKATSSAGTSAPRASGSCSTTATRSVTRSIWCRGSPRTRASPVALGMMAAAYLARRQGRIDDGVVDRHRRLLSTLGLPTSGRFDLEAMQRAWLRDKKYRHGVRFVVLNGLGRAEAGSPPRRTCWRTCWRTGVLLTAHAGSRDAGQGRDRDGRRERDRCAAARWRCPPRAGGVVLAGRRRDALGNGGPTGTAAGRLHPVADRRDRRRRPVRTLFDAAGRRPSGGWTWSSTTPAGRVRPVEIDALPLTDWQAVVAVNLTGVYLCTREAFRVMKAQRPQGGRIINNGSISAQVPRPLSAAYTATKHAVSGLTKSTVPGRAALQHRLRPDRHRQRGVRDDRSDGGRGSAGGRQPATRAEDVAGGRGRRGRLHGRPPARGERRAA
jgi:hypothetical protein